jgi:hypothetical protein
MRPVLLLVVVGCVVGCGSLATSPGDGSGEVWIDPAHPGAHPGFGCTQDSECPTGDVCARVGGCTAAGEVRAVHVTWTLSGKPADAASCSATPDLRIQFGTAEEIATGIGYAPVPCRQGKFTIDKMPLMYKSVRLSKNDFSASGDIARLDEVTGEVTIDLPF